MNNKVKILGAVTLLAASISSHASNNDGPSNDQPPATHPADYWWLETPAYPQPQPVHPWLEAWQNWATENCEKTAQSAYQRCEDSASIARQKSMQQCLFGGVGYHAAPSGEATTQKSCVEASMLSYSQDLQQCGLESAISKSQCAKRNAIGKLRGPY